MPIQAVYFIPNGPLNVAAMFPNVDLSQIDEYFIEVVNSDNTIVATTPLNKISCCCNAEKVRVFFLNYLGTYDAVNFNKPKIVHDTTSAEYLKSLPLNATANDAGYERYSVNSNDFYEAKTNCFAEKDMSWLQELSDSVKAFQHFKVTQGQQNNYVAIKIIDAKFEKQKNEKEYNYDFMLQYKLANGFKSIRN